MDCDLDDKMRKTASVFLFSQPVGDHFLMRKNKDLADYFFDQKKQELEDNKKAPIRGCSDGLISSRLFSVQTSAGENSPGKQGLFFYTRMPVHK